MAGKIEYALGLTTGGFLGPLGSASARLAGFIGLAGGLGGAMAGIFAEINRGGALKDLSNRTAESVQNLFQLQFAFEQSGVAAGSVASVLQKYRAALSGVGEMGESTAEAFQLIGTSIEDLKRLDAPQALEAVFSGLNKLDRNTAAGVAAKIFGRGASGDILQLARDSEGFAAALKDAAAQGATFDRMANAFDNIGDQLGRLKLQARGIFLGLATDIGPALNGIFTTLADRDFQTLGKIAELSLTVAFEKSVNFLASALTKLFAALPNLIKGAGSAGAGAVGAPILGWFAEKYAGILENNATRFSGFSDADRSGWRKEAAGWRLFAAAAKDAAPEAMKQAGEQFVQSFRDAMNATGPDLFGGANAAALAELLKPFGADAAGDGPGLGGLGAGFSMSGGSVTLAYASGSGSSTVTFTGSRTVYSGETGTLDYTQPGNGIEDATGNDLATIAGKSVINNSTQTAPTGNIAKAFQFPRGLKVEGKR